jgi:hypothetical protein
MVSAATETDPKGPPMTAAPAPHRLRALAIVLVVSGATLLSSACGGSDGDRAVEKRSGSAAQGSSASDDSGSGDESIEAGGETPDPCSLISAADLQAVWGVEFNDGTSSETTPPFTFHACGFGQTSDQPPARTLTVQVLGVGDIDEDLRDRGQTPTTLFEGMRDSASDATPIEGLGDGAYRSGSQVAFVSGDVFFTLDAPGASNPETLEGLESLAGTVAGNL